MANIFWKKTFMLLLGMCILSAYCVYYTANENATMHDIRVLGFFAIIQLIYTFYSWYYCQKSLINAYTMFMVACYAFNLGQPILEVFNATAVERSMLQHYNISNQIYYTATFVSLFFIQAFHFGALASLKTQSVFLSIKVSNPADNFLKVLAIRKVARILAILSFPCYLYNLVIIMITTSLYGYVAIYDEGVGTIRLFSIIGDFYTPSLICLYFVAEYTKTNQKLIGLLLLITVCFPPLYIGGRSNAMIILAIIYIVFSLFHKFKIRQALGVGVIIYFIFLVFNIIAYVRTDANRSIEVYSKTINDISDNPILFTLSEMGASMQPLCHVLEIVPQQQDFRYGSSYLYSFTTAIPNIGFWPIHPATKYANLGNWLQDYLNLSYGPGFSIVAEGYINFGYWGFIILFILGYYMAKIFKYVNRKNLDVDPVKLIVSIIFLWFSIKIVRNSFENVVRAILYYCLPIYLLITYTYKVNQSRLSHINRFRSPIQK